MVVIRVAEVVRGHLGPPPKSLDSDENFKPDERLPSSATLVVINRLRWRKKIMSQDALNKAIMR